MSIYLLTGVRLWTAQTSTGDGQWYAVAPSSDGSKLLAVQKTDTNWDPGYICNGVGPQPDTPAPTSGKKDYWHRANHGHESYRSFHYSSASKVVPVAAATVVVVAVAAAVVAVVGNEDYCWYNQW